MEESVGQEFKSDNLNKRIYHEYGAGVAYISVVDRNGDESIGSCFHIGDGIFITARHVVDGFKIKEIGTTVYQRKYFETEETKETGMARVELPFVPTKTKKFEGPFFHPDETIDVAAIKVADIKAPILYLGDHLDDWLGDEYVLSEVIVMGYPPIPFAREPLLIVSKSEINAIVDKYTGGHPHFILSSMARGGFSGGPAITNEGVVLGVITESLIANSQPTELGYLSVMSVEGIYNCISHHRIVPEHIDKKWEGFWNKESKMYSANPSEHIDISIYRGTGNFYIEIFSFKKDVIEKAILIFDKEEKDSYSVNWIHDKMIKIEFSKAINENKANELYSTIIDMVEGYGYKTLGEAN